MPAVGCRRLPPRWPPRRRRSRQPGFSRRVRRTGPPGGFRSEVRTLLRVTFGPAAQNCRTIAELGEAIPDGMQHALAGGAGVRRTLAFTVCRRYASLGDTAYPMTWLGLGLHEGEDQ